MYYCTYIHTYIWDAASKEKRYRVSLWNITKQTAVQRDEGRHNNNIIKQKLGSVARARHVKMNVGGYLKLLPSGCMVSVHKVHNYMIDSNSFIIQKFIFPCSKKPTMYCTYRTYILQPLFSLTLNAKMPLPKLSRGLRIPSSQIS